MKKILLILCGVIGLNACTLHKVTNQQQLCDQAKRQQVFNATNPSFDANYLTSAQKKALSTSEQTNCGAS